MIHEIRSGGLGFAANKRPTCRSQLECIRDPADACIFMPEPRARINLHLDPAAVGERVGHFRFFATNLTEMIQWDVKSKRLPAT